MGNRELYTARVMPTAATFRDRVNLLETQVADLTALVRELSAAVEQLEAQRPQAHKVPRKPFAIEEDLANPRKVDKSDV